MFGFIFPCQISVKSCWTHMELMKSSASHSIASSKAVWLKKSLFTRKTKSAASSGLERKQTLRVSVAHSSNSLF